MAELKRIHDKVIEKTHKTVHAQPVISWHGFVERSDRDGGKEGMWHRQVRV